MISNVNNLPLPMSAFKMNLKNIGGKLYRINNLINLKKSDTIYNSDTSNKTNVKEFKLMSNINNLTKKFSEVISDDDATSYDDYSGNVSFLSSEDENNNTLIQNEDLEDMNDVDSFMLFSNKDTQIGSKIPLMKPTPPKIKWTHFLSIPLHTNKEFIDKFEFFKRKIQEENFADIDESLFQKNTRLHLTICLFRIEKQEQINLITKLIKEAEENIKTILDGNPLYIDFDQLEIMGTQDKTRVLYTRPHLTDSEKLRNVIDILINKFIDNELITEEMKQNSHLFFNEMTERYENEKLHLTLMNSVFVMRDKKDKNKQFFNGMKIIKKMKNFSFGIHSVDEIVLNEMRIDFKTDSYKIEQKFKIIN